MVARTDAVIEAELAEARLELLRLRADADRKMRTMMLQSEIKIAVVRRSMAVAAQAQRDVAKAQRDVEEVLKSNSWRATGPFRQLSKELGHVFERVKRWRERSKADAASPRV